MNTMIIDETPGAFLPSHVLDLSIKVFRHDFHTIVPSIALISWRTVEEVKRFYSEYMETLDKSFENEKEREYWRQHELYKFNDKAALKSKCKKEKLSVEGKKH